MQIKKEEEDSLGSFYNNHRQLDKEGNNSKFKDDNISELLSVMGVSPLNPEDFLSTQHNTKYSKNNTKLPDKNKISSSFIKESQEITNELDVAPPLSIPFIIASKAASTANTSTNPIRNLANQLSSSTTMEPLLSDYLIQELLLDSEDAFYDNLFQKKQQQQQKKAEEQTKTIDTNISLEYIPEIKLEPEANLKIKDQNDHNNSNFIFSPMDATSQTIITTKPDISTNGEIQDTLISNNVCTQNINFYSNSSNYLNVPPAHYDSDSESSFILDISTKHSPIISPIISTSMVGLEDDINAIFLGDQSKSMSTNLQQQHHHHHSHQQQTCSSSVISLPIPTISPTPSLINPTAVTSTAAPNIASSSATTSYILDGNINNSSFLLPNLNLGNNNGNDISFNSTSGSVSTSINNQNHPQQFKKSDSFHSNFSLFENNSLNLDMFTNNSSDALGTSDLDSILKSLIDTNPSTSTGNNLTENTFERRQDQSLFEPSLPLGESFHSDMTFPVSTTSNNPFLKPTYNLNINNRNNNHDDRRISRLPYAISLNVYEKSLKSPDPNLPIESDPEDDPGLGYRKISLKKRIAEKLKRTASKMDHPQENVPEAKIRDLWGTLTKPFLKLKGNSKKKKSEAQAVAVVNEKTESSRVLLSLPHDTENCLDEPLSSPDSVIDRLSSSLKKSAKQKQEKGQRKNSGDSGTTRKNEIPKPILFEIDGQVRYRCPYMDLKTGAPCEKIYSRSTGNITTHMKKDHENQENQFTCPECPRTFSRSNDMKRHVREVHGEQYYYCPFCNVGRKRKDQLTQHIFKMHTKRGES